VSSFIPGHLLDDTTRASGFLLEGDVLDLRRLAGRQGVPLDVHGAGRGAFALGALRALGAALAHERAAVGAVFLALGRRGRQGGLSTHQNIVLFRSSH